ncbi:MAG: hypothetical protein ACKV2Q_05830 [Planctomycetaceae bacterium]
MSQRPHLKKNLIDPVYSQSRPNELIEISSVQVRLRWKEYDLPATAAVKIRFTPTPRLLFCIPEDLLPPFFSLQLFVDDDTRTCKLLLEELGLDLDFLIASSGGELGLVLEPTISIVPAMKPTNDIHRMMFHLLNFPEFHGPEGYIIVKEEQTKRTHHGCGQVTLRGGGWLVVIAAMESTSELCKSLKSEGGYAITHVGTVEREDGSTFDSEAAQELLKCLHHFLSFALGRWAGVALPIGFDAGGNRVFEQWGLPRIGCGPRYDSCSWWDALHSEILSEVFPGFLSLWKSSLWYRSLREALYFYLGATIGNGIGIDSSLVLAQAALERLSWNFFIFDKKTISKTRFKKQTASESLRQLLASCKIPLPIGQTLEALRRNLNSNKHARWIDGPAAITAIRNRVVHPEPEDPLVNRSEYEGWCLAMWYIDLVLLFLCGHQGQYANRLTKRWSGTLEWVPWANQT